MYLNKSNRFWLSPKKHIAMFFATVLITFSSCSFNSSSLSGDISGVDSDTLLLVVSDMNSGERLYSKKVALENEHFEIQLSDSALYVSIMAQPKAPNRALRMPSGGPVFYFPGDRLRVSGSINDLKITGSELYDDLSKNLDVIRIEREMHLLNDKLIAAIKADEKSKIKEYKAKYLAAREELYDVQFRAIQANPNAMSSAYYATKMKAEEGLKAIKLLSKDVLNGPMGSQIKKAKESFENTIARKKAASYIKPGNSAPELHLSTIDGKEITLSAFRGKYLLLDFWGSWCGWCIKGFPDMKKYYLKYKDQIEFLGISCNDTEKKWRKAVSTHQLPWVNAIEGKSKASVVYAVCGFPTKILVDPEGKIVEVIVGESPELYKRLDEMFGK